MSDINRSSSIAETPEGSLVHLKADLDVAYLKEKKIPLLLESLAAEFIVHKPHDPETFLRNRFFVGSEGSIDTTGEAGIITTSTLCPYSALVKMAASRCSARMDVRDTDPTAAAVSGNANNNKSVISPFGKLPYVEHNGMVLLEVGPIARYLCHGTPFLPSTFRARVKVEVAFDMIVANILPHASVAVNEKYVIPRAKNRPVDAAAIQQSASKFRSDLVQVVYNANAPSSSAALFTESSWVAGREPSIADMALAAGLFAIQSVGGYDCITGLSVVESWWEVVQQEQWFVKGLGQWQSLALSLHSR